eukprot:scaffold66084_cov27-Attheya_sp.AAC.1
MDDSRHGATTDPAIRAPRISNAPPDSLSLYTRHDSDRSWFHRAAIGRSMWTTSRELPRTLPNHATRHYDDATKQAPHRKMQSSPTIPRTPPTRDCDYRDRCTQEEKHSFSRCSFLVKR